MPQLVDPAAYRPCEWDLKRDADGLAYWINLFCEHLELLARLIAEEYPRADAGRMQAFRRDYLETMQAVQREPQRFARVDVLLLTELRRDLLDRHGFHDPFAGVKRRENAAALELLPGLLAELDALPAEDQLETLVIGLMAGNLFDLGAMPTVERYREQKMDFAALRAAQPRRPWVVDDLDLWRQQWEHGSDYRHVLFFVDNAGSDIYLGCLPLVRWMLLAGSRVTLAANSGAALNDVTAPELVELLDQAAQRESSIRAALAARRLSVTASGSTTPLLDLTALSADCVAAAGDADLIMLHGMGRGIESNADAMLRCDAVRTAVLKDPAVARHAGGQLFDCLFRFTPGATR